MSKVHFEKLTPKQDVDLKIYSEALDYVFKNKDIKNIAISGSYSAGKSSIIESYKNRHKEKKFMHVSLAKFVMETQSDKDLNDKSSNDRINDSATDGVGNSTSNKNNSKIEAPLLEGKILNQILHQIDSSKIAQTNFKIKQNVSDNNIIKVTGFVIISIISIFHILFNNTWSLLVDELVDMKFFRFLDITTSPVSILISFIILIGMLSYLLFSLMKAQKNRNIFKKFSVQGNEIEILENSNESYFDKYLNEVLYLFDNSGVDVIVFEDMDRYNMNQIFQRLKEVNTLINIKRKNKGINPLRFFYLLRDDIFISKDRTKFFDFIMPAVPVIDSSNSYDQFISHFKKGGTFEKFNNQFLQRISLYVDDMRILKNIYNEFIIYNSMISEIEPDYNKLLAMIVYKNIFPKDFADTQLNKGFVSTIFNKKDEIISNEIINIENESIQIKKKIQLCNTEHLKNIDELEQITRNKYGYNYQTKSEYIERKEIINIIENNQTEKLEKQDYKLYLKKSGIKNFKMHKLISRENEKEIFSMSYSDFLGNKNNFEEVKTSEYFGLIKYLIWEGHIDETYEDYMTYFYPHSLTANDKRFVRSVLDKDAKQWEYNIDNKKLVISMLREVDFRERETLNFNILDYLCSNMEDEKNKLIEFITQLKVDKNYKFIQRYLKYTDNVVAITKYINHYWSTFLVEIIKNKELSYIEIKDFILNTIYYCDINDIDIINEDGFLTNHISDDPEFLNIEAPKIEQLIKGFINIEIKFISINYDDADKDLFESIYENKCYEFSYKNISLMLYSIHGINDISKINHENYSLIKKDSTSKLYEYVIEEIDSYLPLYLENCEGMVSDNIEDALDLINNEIISFEDRKQYLEYLTTDLKDITKINDVNLWSLLIEKNLVDYNEDNIVQYYFKSGKSLDDILVNFIDNNIDYSLELSNEDIEKEFGDGKSEEFVGDIIINSNISNKKYKEILQIIKKLYDEFDIVDICDEKIKILIELGIIIMNQFNLEFMRTNHNSNFIYFVENNILTYINDLMEISALTHSETLELLNRNLADNHKGSLLNQITIPITSLNNNYSDFLKEHIILNNFERNDLKSLLNNYESYNESVKLAILEISKKYIVDIIADKIILSNNQFILLIMESDVNKLYKIGILSNILKSISKEDFQEYIRIIDYDEYLRIFSKTGRLPRVEINEYNKKLLDALKDRYWIFDYVEKENMYKVKRITKTNRLLY